MQWTKTMNRLLCDHQRRFEAVRSSAQVLVKRAWFKRIRTFLMTDVSLYIKTGAI